MLAGHVFLIVWGILMSIVGVPKSIAEKILATFLWVIGIILVSYGI